MKAVSFDKIRLGGFWKHRADINEKSTVPAIYDRFFETGRIDAFKFEWKDGDKNKPHIFWDSDVAKWIEAAAYTITTRPNKDLEQIIDGIVDLIEKNQDENGYFNIYFTVCEPDKRFQNRSDHELYCAGHLTEAAIAYFNATGKDKFLNLMKKYLDLIETVFIKEDSAAFSTPGHEEIELALVKLYDLTGEKKYLEMSRHFVDTRGTSPKDGNSNYDQSDMPVRQMTLAQGHSVRAVYLYCAMADLALRLNDKSLFDACRNLFENIALKRMYITGGIGSTFDGERFTQDYDLPNDIAYAETCAAIGLALFARRMSLASPDSFYDDIAEKAIYNGALAGVSLDGKAFFYVNPLEINLERAKIGKEFYKTQKSGYALTQRAEVFSCSCCPPNIARFIASIGDFLYTLSDNTIYVHHYMQSEALFDEIKICQKTDYPNNGKIEISVEAPCKKTLALRIPCWCDSFTLNGKKFEGKTEKGFIFVDISEKEEIVLELKTECRLVWSNPAVEANLGRATLCRGPLVYCAERTDNVVALNNLSISQTLNAKEEFDETMQAFKIETDGFEDVCQNELYCEKKPELKPRRIKFIPYFAFANRGESDMLVWLRTK